MVLFCKSEKSFEKKIPSERASQGEQNGTNFSFIAPSSDEHSKFSKSTTVTTFTMHIHLTWRKVSVAITPHWKVLRS